MLDTLLSDGWSYHDSESARLAMELEGAASAAEDAQLDPLLHLANHTIGEHLGDWPRARRLAEALIDRRSPRAETAKAWSRLAVVRAMTSDAPAAAAAELAAAAVATDPLASTLEGRFLLVAALIGSKRVAEGAVLYEAALRLADKLGDAAPARAIAVASNNLASDLVEAVSRTTVEDSLMRRAAEAAHEYWRRCGTWVNDERALYLKALVANALAEPADALAHAEAALAIIAANGEQPVDVTFLTLAKSRSLRLLGDATASAATLADADAAAAAWDDPGLKSWYAEERARAVS